MTEPTAESPGAIRDNREASRFELEVNGQVAILEYRRRHDLLWLIHTEVPVPIRGRGFAGALAKWALDLAEREKLRVIVACPSVAEYMRRHPEYNHLLARPLPEAEDGG